MQDGGGLHVRALASRAPSQSQTVLRVREELRSGTGALRTKSRFEGLIVHRLTCWDFNKIWYMTPKFMGNLVLKVVARVHLVPANCPD